MKAKQPRFHSTAVPSLLTPEQVAHDLEIGKGTLRKLLQLGRDGDPGGLRSVRLTPQVIRIPRTEIESFISRRLSGGQAESGR